MSDKEDYLTSYREFFESFAATVNPEDQLPVHVAGYTITEAELPGETLYWTTQYLTEKQCPATLLTPLRRIVLDEVRAAAKKQPTDLGFRPEENVYIALRLMQAVTARVNTICLRYLDNAQLDTLPPPPAPHLRELKTTSAAHKNTRRVMEDRHVEIGNLEALFGIETTEPTSFYAVYDGHAGSAAAVYCAAHLHQYLVESPHFHTDLRHALRDAFLRTDADFVSKSNQERANGGSTAVVIVVRGKSLHAAWAGDSQALLAKRMRLMQLVHPHKPSRQDEKDRIEASGGTVMYWGTWRVNGQLAVSRAIGDAQYKPYVTAKPEIATVELDGDEDFVVIACDGLWDFVSEDQVAIAVYWQIGADPDDLKAVSKRLIVQAKRQQSSDNISVIVVFLKEPRLISAENRPPMDLGLDNALANGPPPFAVDADACKRQLDAVPDPVDNGILHPDNGLINPDNGLLHSDNGLLHSDNGLLHSDNGLIHPDNGLIHPDNGLIHSDNRLIHPDNSLDSDSDSEDDLGPETAVDVDVDDVDADKNHAAAAPTPPAHTLEEEGQTSSGLVENVGESGEESEDEWNYFKGEGESKDEPPPSDEREDLPRSETPCQDTSAWETSSVDMNSSPLNPDAPVFIPGTTAGSDVLLAESPRKPLPMDDIELPDRAQFETEAVVRPKELLDLDNCDQLNGHHNISLDEAGKLNGNDNTAADTLGTDSFAVFAAEARDSSLLLDLDRIQKDTTDFCNIQVFQAHTETNPFATEASEELLERLKNKERDPMSMSFYQEKDADSSSRPASPVDLNVVRPLPDSDDDEPEPTDDKENVPPDNDAPLEDRVDQIENSLSDYTRADNMTDYGNAHNLVDMDFGAIDAREVVEPTDTPESHKLMFEQIPEIPDGKSSELGFCDDSSQDVDMEPAVDADRDSGVTSEPPASPDQRLDHELVDDTCEDSKEEDSAPEKMLDFVQLQAGEGLDVAPAPSPAPCELVPAPLQREPTPEPAPLQREPTPEPARDATPEPQPEPAREASPEPEPAYMASPVPEPAYTSEPEATIAASPVPEAAYSASPVPEPAYAASPVPEAAFAASPAPEAAYTASPVPEPADVASPVPEPEPAHAASPAPSPAPPREASPAPALSPLPVDVPLPRDSPAPQDRHSPEPTQSLPPVEESQQQSASAELLARLSPAPGDVRAPDLVPAAPEQSAPAAPEPSPAAPAAAAAAGLVATAAAVTATAAAKAKTPIKKTAPAAKTPAQLTPKPAPKTPVSATKKPAASAAARPSPRAAPARPSTTAAGAKPTASKPTAAPVAPRTALTARAAPGAKPAAPRAAPAPRAAAPKPAPAKEPTAKPATARPAAATRPAPRAALTSRPAAPRTTLAAKPKEPAEKKPLTNGTAPPARKPLSAPSARPAPAARAAPARPAATARPAPRAAPAAAPRPAPRPATTTATTKSSSAPSRPLDKPGKELANRRATAARPAAARPAPAKATAKPNTMRPVPKKPLEAKKAAEMNGLSNGEGEKLPPSPGDAALPDVIA